MNLTNAPITRHPKFWITAIGIPAPFILSALVLLGYEGNDVYQAQRALATAACVNIPQGEPMPVSCPTPGPQSDQRLQIVQKLRERTALLTTIELSRGNIRRQLAPFSTFVQELPPGVRIQNVSISDDGKTLKLTADSDSQSSTQRFFLAMASANANIDHTTTTDNNGLVSLTTTVTMP